MANSIRLFIVTCKRVPQEYVRHPGRDDIDYLHDTKIDPTVFCDYDTAVRAIDSTMKMTPLAGWPPSRESYEVVELSMQYIIRRKDPDGQTNGRHGNIK